jgi:DnaJ-class molecular chaperone
MTFTVSVTLDELYAGGKKKIAMRRQKLEPDGSYEEEKKKLSIKIEPGMIDEQTIRFNHMADEKQGYETGDVVVCLDVEEHPLFTRDGNNLIVEKEISFSETFDPVIYIKHLNGKMYTIKGEPFDIFDEENSLLKKVKGLGMPVLGEPGIYGDLFIKFTCVNKTKITPEILKQLKEMFPPIETKPDTPSEEIIQAEFEMVTDTDLEFLDFDSDDSDYSDSETDISTDEESED